MHFAELHQAALWGQNAQHCISGKSAPQAIIRGCQFASKSWLT